MFPKAKLKSRSFLVKQKYYFIESGFRGGSGGRGGGGGYAEGREDVIRVAKRGGRGGGVANINF